MRRKPMFLKGPEDVFISAQETPAFYHLLKEALLLGLHQEGILQEETLARCLEQLGKSPPP